MPNTGPGVSAIGEEVQSKLTGGASNLHHFVIRADVYVDAVVSISVWQGVDFCALKNEDHTESVFYSHKNIMCSVDSLSRNIDELIKPN